MVVTLCQDSHIGITFQNFEACISHSRIWKTNYHWQNLCLHRAWEGVIVWTNALAMNDWMCVECQWNLGKMGCECKLTPSFSSSRVLVHDLSHVKSSGTRIWVAVEIQRHSISSVTGIWVAVEIQRHSISSVTGIWATVDWHSYMQSVCRSVPGHTGCVR